MSEEVLDERDIIPGEMGMDGEEKAMSEQDVLCGSAGEPSRSSVSTPTASPFLAQSRMLGGSLIAIVEKDDPSKFRVYRLSSRRPSISTVYYRCLKCDAVEKKGHEKRYAPYVKAVRGRLVGNTYPEHHPECQAITRYDMRLYSKELSRNENSGPSEIERLLRFISETCVRGSAGPVQDSSVYPVEGASASTDCLSVIVPEPDGIAVRIYSRGSKSADGEEIYYHCSRCNNLCRKSGSGSVRATLRVENGMIHEMYPAHHVNCAPTSLESLRGLGDDLKNFCVVADHKIIPLKAVVESKSGSHHETEESFSAGRSNEQSWDPEMEEEMSDFASPTSNLQVRGRRCSCKRLYEENVELYQEMMRNLDEMRALVGEMKRITGADATEYYIDEGEVLEEGDDGAIYVVEE